MEWIYNPEAWIALSTLTALEIILGIDNIIFISLLVGRVEESEQAKARILGLALAMFSRIILLLSLNKIMSLVDPIFTIFRNEISIRDIILIIGALFLLAKSTHEIHQQVEETNVTKSNRRKVSFTNILLQIAVIDIIFSLDSVITAVGLAQDIAVMIIAVVISVFVMMLAAKSIGNFVNKHPTIKVLALSFLLLIGLTLLAEGLNFHVPKGYVYFAMAFSMGVEFINMKIRRVRKNVTK